MFDLTGKSAIVTGATRGIGRAITEAQIAQGTRVVIASGTEIDWESSTCASRNKPSGSPPKS